VFTDSVELYRSRLAEMRSEQGPYRAAAAGRDHAAVLLHQGIDYYKELGYYDRKAIHNLKYFTWVEQQGMAVEELNAQWQPQYWQEIYDTEIAEVDRLIADFNREAGARSPGDRGPGLRGNLRDDRYP
jgi:cysteine synthase A